MNIYAILETKPHNSHYLKRYIKFIEYCRSLNATGIIEEHHILPKAKDMFPEYKSFKKYPDNKVVLSLRQHYLAHWLLWKTFGGSQTRAFKMMSCLMGSKSSRAYLIVKEHVNMSMTGMNNPNFDGRYSKQYWKKSTKERREMQSKLMADINKKTKSKPKEMREYVCSHCNDKFYREEHTHKAMSTTQFCSGSHRTTYFNNRRKSS